MPTLSVAIQHTPWIPERVDALGEMVQAIPRRVPTRIFRDRRPERMLWEEFKTVLALDQWEWSLKTECTHHLFLTDDLHMAPNFWLALNAMIEAKPNAIIGLLSNHPQAVEEAAKGNTWYRCNSWIVGPAYVVPTEHLRGFLAWYSNLRDDADPGGRRWFNDDSALNEWNSLYGPKESWHPLPTIIEHRHDLKSTVGHGDMYSRERVSWRATRTVQHHEDGFSWIDSPAQFDLEGMCHPPYWQRLAPMLQVGDV